jgi:hypothetical protein
LGEPGRTGAVKTCANFVLKILTNNQTGKKQWNQ